MENLKKTSFEDYPITLKVQEVAEILRINQTKAYELVKRKDFPAMKLGNRVIVNRDAFQNWYNQAVCQ